MRINIKLIAISFLGAAFLLPQKTKAQQNPEYTQYMYNTITINPGYTGSPGVLEANLLLRSQWVGIDGAPRTGTLGVHSPISDKIGLGLNVIADKIGPSTETSASGNFSYTLNLGYKAKLAFGLKAGARVLNVDWSKGRYLDSNDVLLNNNISNKIMPLIGAGLYLYGEKWYLGASVPNFIKQDYYDDIQESVMADKLHYYLIGGYVFDVTDGLKFKPSVMLKAVSGAPLAADLSANFLIQEKVTLGASYRWDDSVSAMAGLQFLDHFFIGYAFDYSTTKLNKYNDGTHEIILRFQLPPKSSAIKSPRFF
ncbi:MULTISPECIES: type IX secretion system membrane protein PorP/SprF [unclassified Flavobacterium]|uniref:PorP/SprF family type IX secretion system membrane protein n=1 Tax=unclassified Flavobacterium TaxID=196869 RepID=UPI002604F676|nr:type IX secretion system membrane protein PorP/SprF [Flavobacterium sp.]